MLRDRNAPALSGKWNKWNRDNHTISEVVSRVRSEMNSEVNSEAVALLSQRARSEELRWLNAPEFQVRAEMEKRLEAYFKRKREKAA